VQCVHTIRSHSDIKGMCWSRIASLAAYQNPAVQLQLVTTPLNVYFCSSANLLMKQPGTIKMHAVYVIPGHAARGIASNRARRELQDALQPAAAAPQ
jgi:hypothetical protein